MSAFTGPQGKGAMRRHREGKRVAAGERNAKTPPERRRQYRRDAVARLITEVFTGDPA